MKRTSLFAITCAAVLAVVSAGTASAADKKLSVSGFGQVSKYSGSDATGLLYGQVGYLFTERIEGGLLLSQTLGSGAAESTGLGVFGRYYLGGLGQTKTWLPYAHAAVVRVSSSGPDATQLRGGVGVDIPLSDATSLMAEAAISRQDFSGGARTVNGSEVLLGLKVRF